MMTRQKKQFFYSILYVIFFLFVFGTIIATFIPNPTCSDGKQNQREEGVDCGGSCAPCDEITDAQDILVREVAFVESSSDTWDILATIYNPNSLYGSGSFEYTLDIYDIEGNLISSFSDETYILPAQQRYIMVLEQSFPKDPGMIDVRISTVQWERFEEYEAPSLVVTNRSYEELSSGSDYSRAQGLVRNQSPYDFETVEIFVVLRDASGSVLAMNRTDMQTVRSGERRDFPVTWKYPIQGEVATVDAQAITNMFENQNFIKLFFPGGRFQEYE